MRLSAQTPFDADTLLAFLAARAIPGVEEVSGRVYRRRGVEIRLRDDGADVECEPELLPRVRALLDLDADPAAIGAALSRDPALAPLVAVRPGLRAPGAIDRAEVVVRAIVGQQISVPAARTVLGRLADGGRFPAPAELAALDPEVLPMPRSRGRALVGAMAAVADDPALLDEPDRLLELPGIGPWTVAYVRLRLGDRDAWPATDLIARRAVVARGARPEAWSPYRAYGLHHLWAADATTAS